MALTEMSVWPNMTLGNSTFSSLAMSCGRMVYIPVHNLLHKQLAYIQNTLYFTAKVTLFCARNYDNGCRSMRRQSHLIQFVRVNVHASNTFSGISTIICYLQLFISVHNHSEYTSRLQRESRERYRKHLERSTFLKYHGCFQLWGIYLLARIV